jgi:uncharacterized SAM-binding protein YcdF (DUF218 family)
MLRCVVERETSRLTAEKADPEDVPAHKPILVLLGARMARTRGPDRWRFPLFLEEPDGSATGLPGEVSGGSSRMRAIQAEYARLRETHGIHKLLVLVTGGEESDGSSRANEATQQLVWRYGLPADAVVSIRGAGSTLGNSAATVEHIRARPHIAGDVSSIAIVTNDYHMLRAWIIFSRDMLLATTGTELVVSIAEQDRIRRILRDGLPADPRWTQGRVKKDRERVMKILRPHFAPSRIEMTPLVVEEVLERSSGCPAALRYAARLRNSMWAKETLRFEYERVMELLGEHGNSGSA